MKLAFSGAEALLPFRKQTAAEQRCRTELLKRKMETELLRLLRLMLNYGSFLYYPMESRLPSIHPTPGERHKGGVLNVFLSSPSLALSLGKKLN